MKKKLTTILLITAPIFAITSCSINKKEFIYSSTRAKEEISNIIIGPGNPWNPIDPPNPFLEDASTSFENAIELGLETNNTYIENYQYDTDNDYYCYTAIHSNYISFNIEYRAGSLDWYYSNIVVYKEIEDINGINYEYITSYTNSLTITGQNIQSLYTIYADAGEAYYFKAYKNSIPIGDVIPMSLGDGGNDPDVIASSYTAKLYCRNQTDIPDSQYLTAEYIQDYESSYLSDSIITVWFDDSCNISADSNNQYTYYDYYYEAMQEWNKVGVIQFQEVSQISNADVFCTVLPGVHENPEYSNYRGLTTPFCINNVCYRREVWVANGYLFNDTYNEILGVAIHEFGHCLGINHINSDGGTNVMYLYASMFQKFGKGDIDVYRYLFGF